MNMKEFTYHLSGVPAHDCVSLNKISKSYGREATDVSRLVEQACATQLKSVTQRHAQKLTRGLSANNAPSIVGT